MAGNAPIAAIEALEHLDTHAAMQKDFLAVAEDRVRDGLPDPPRPRARLQLTLGTVYRNLDILQETGTGRREFEFAKGPVFANIVLADDKYRARLNCISHLLDSIPYQPLDAERRAERTGGQFEQVASHDGVDLVLLIDRVAHVVDADGVDQAVHVLAAEDGRVEVADRRRRGDAEQYDCGLE